jgi:hypothetical protein
MTDALVPVEQRTVEFYEDKITAALTEEGEERQVYVPIRPICDLLGVDWSAQRQRINRDPVLSDVVSGVVITPTPLDENKFANPQEMLCIPLDYLNGWLFGINANRVKEEVRDRLLRYQRECYQVLAEAFLGRPATVDLSPEATESIAALQQIRDNALAVARLAEEQIRLTERVDRAAVVVGQHGRRITALERKLAPPNAITDEQAAEIAQKVKAVAMQMTEHDPGTNHFQGVFSELHRRFGVSSYKNIRQSRYHEVMKFLDEWAARAGDG